jgi:hypothetical protein
MCHSKICITKNQKFDFLRDLVANVPDPVEGGEEEGGGDKSKKKQKQQ